MYGESGKLETLCKLRDFSKEEEEAEEGKGVLASVVVNAACVKLGFQNPRQYMLMFNDEVMMHPKTVIARGSRVRLARIPENIPRDVVKFDKATVALPFMAKEHSPECAVAYACTHLGLQEHADEFSYDPKEHAIVPRKIDYFKLNFVLVLAVLLMASVAASLIDYFTATTN